MRDQKRPWKAMLIGLLTGVLMMGTLAVTTPAIASAPVNFNKIWKKIKPKSDKRYYKKAKSDARYVPKPKVIRGAIALSAAPSGGLSWNQITFGVTLASAPVPHIIESGDAPPPGCSGTVESPSALPGHLCIFEKQMLGMGSRFVSDVGDNGSSTSSTFGAHYGAYTTSDNSQGWGSWAVGVGGVTTARLAPRTSTSGGTGPAGP